MAQEIKQLPPVGGHIPYDEYPWDEWLNGKVWTLVRDLDFTVEVTAMRAYAYRAARSRGIKVKTVRTPGKLHIKAIIEKEEEQ